MLFQEECLPLDLKVEPTVKTIPKQDYFSDNSVSLPGMSQPGPVGFEPGMFKKDPDAKYKLDPSQKVRFDFVFSFAISLSFQLKKKKKDKKKHKHKHKHKHEHKHGKDKEKKDKDKDPNRLKIKEETLSSVSSTPSPGSQSIGEVL